VTPSPASERHSQPSASAVSAARSGPLRIGVLGAARITDLALAQPARVTGDRLVAVAARDPGRAAAAAAELGFERVVGSYAELLADPEIEVIYNPLANGLHGPWNRAAIAAGKHVLSEKPFASNATEAREVAEAAAAAAVTVVEGFHYVHHPVMRRLHELLDCGELGEPSRVETHFAMPAPPDDDPRWSWELAGGALMDLGCYLLHAQRTMAPWAGGEPRVVAARAVERAGRPGIDERLEADLEFPGGVTGLAHCDMAAPDWRITCRLIGTAGEAMAVNFVRPDQDDRVRWIGRDGRSHEEHLGTRSSYTYQLEALRAHLRTGSPFPLDLADAVANADLIDAAYTAAGLTPRTRTPTPTDVIRTGTHDVGSR
jgi:predicted dehydrogenase